MKHELVIEKYYEISFETSNRMLGHKIDTFLLGRPNLDDCSDRDAELWDENHSILRDYEGDFDGIKIYNSEITKPIFEWVCQKLEINHSDLDGANLKLVW